MNEPENLLERTFNFSVNVLNMLGEIKLTSTTSVIIRQLARSATSIGANYEESQASQSRNDFYHKTGICLREARETLYWLRILGQIKVKKSLSELNSLEQEARELVKIFGKIFSGRTKNTE